MINDSTEAEQNKTESLSWRDAEGRVGSDFCNLAWGAAAQLKHTSHNALLNKSVYAWHLTSNSVSVFSPSFLYNSSSTKYFYSWK